MPAIVRVEDLLRIPQLTTGALMYASQSGIPYGTTVSDIINLANNNTGNFATLQQLQNVSGIFNNSGQLLELQINSLSGYSNNVFSTINNLLSTGQTVYNLIVGLSGKLNQTGSSLQIQITNLNNSVSILSGEAGVGSVNALTGNIILTGQGNITITTNGQNINISGNNSAPVTTLPSVNFTTNIDWSLANTFFTTITNSSVFTFTNNQDAKTIIIQVYNSGTNSSIITWPNSVKWPNGLTPTPVTGGIDVYTFVQIQTGIYATVIQNFF